MFYPVSFAGNYNDYRATREAVNRQRAGQEGALDALNQPHRLREEMRSFLIEPFLQVTLDGQDFTFTGESLLQVFETPRSRSRFGDIGNELVTALKLNDPALKVAFLPKEKSRFPGSKPYYKQSQISRLQKKGKLLPVLSKLLNQKVNMATQYGFLRTDWKRAGLLRAGGDRLVWTLTPQGKSVSGKN